jgi:hypothetical protein
MRLLRRSPQRSHQLTPQPSTLELPYYDAGDRTVTPNPQNIPHSQASPPLSIAPPAYDGVRQDAPGEKDILPLSAPTRAGENSPSGTEGRADGASRMSGTGGVEGDPTVLVMLLQDYRRSKIFVREMEWKVALRKCLRKQLYSMSAFLTLPWPLHRADRFPSEWYALAAIILALTALLSAKHEDTVKFLEPFTRRIRAWPGGFLIPFVVLIVLSFPPLIGHESKFSFNSHIPLTKRGMEADKGRP